MLYDESHCNSCKQITAHYNGKCGLCENKQKSEHKKSYLKALKKLPLKKRIDKLEELLYDMTFDDDLTKYGN